MADDDEEANKQEREEELEALEEIFPGWVKSKTHLSLSISVAVELDAEAGVEVLAGHPVRFLPDIELGVTLPCGYPSTESPSFSVVCSWLTAAECAAAETELDLVASELGGMAVLFSCIERLRELSAARTELVVEENDALKLIAYDESHFRACFAENSHQCPVCFEAVSGSSCQLLTPCRHFVCLDCLASLCRVHITEGSLQQLRCCSPGCNSEIPVQVLRSLVNPAAFARWERLLFEKTMDKMPDLVFCPRCSTPTLEDNDHCAQCPACCFAFCGLCREAWHGGTECLDPEAALRVLEARRRGGAVSAAALAKEKDLAQQLDSMRMLKKETKQCPGCRMGITKNEGCNKMHCTHCGRSFCWLCLKDITEEGYVHFRVEGGAPCSGRLFEGVLPEAAIYQHAALAAFGGGGFVGNDAGGAQRLPTANCPTCGQENWRMAGNNHMRCWSCGGHFCFLCRASIRKASDHFRRGGRCKQHGS